MDAGLAALLGVLAGSLITLVMNYFTTRMTLHHQSELAKLSQQEVRRTARHEYLTSLILRLLEAYEEYEQYLAQYPLGTPKGEEEAKGRVWHAKIIGKAIAACLAASDSYDSSDEYGKCLTVAADDEHDEEYRRCASQHKERLSFIALKRLTRNFVDNGDWLEVKVWREYKNRNRDALNDAVRILAGYIASLQ